MSFINRDLKSISKNEWESILKQGAFRGKKVNRLAKSLSKSSCDLIFDSKKNQVYINANGTPKYRVDLIDIKRCRSTWTISRINHWISKHIFRKDQSKFNNEINNLANEIYSKLHASSTDINKKSSKLHASSIDKDNESPSPYDLLKGLSATELNDYLDAHPVEISQLALNAPDDWLSFTRKARTCLDDAQLLDRLNQLDQIITKHLGIETHYYTPFNNNELTSVDDINNKILDDGFVKYKDSITYARQISDTIELMKELYKGTSSDTDLIFGAIRVQPFARFVNQNEIAINDLKLSHEDLLRLIPHLSYLDLRGHNFCLDLIRGANNVTALLFDFIYNANDSRSFNFESMINALPSKESLTTLYYEDDCGYDIKSLVLVTNLKNLSLNGLQLENYSTLEELKQLEKLSLYLLGEDSYKFLQSLSWLKSLSISGPDITNKNLSDLNSLKNLESLELSYCQYLNSMENLTGPFPKLKLLDLSGSGVEKFILKSKGRKFRTPDQTLETCKDLQKIPFLSQLSTLKLSNQLTCSAADIQDIMNPTDDWLNAPWPK